MAYRPPGTYARFVRTVSPVTNAGNSRIMAIAGTGINYFTVENEAITKSKTKPYDTLQNSNVFEVMSVSSRPIYNGLITSNNTIYYPSTETQKGYTVNDNVIRWDSLIDADVIVDYKSCPDFYLTQNSGIVTYNIEYSVDETALYPVEDGNWVIEVSYINEDDIDAAAKLGCYRIINSDTSEIVGEYVVSDNVVTNEDGTYPIPGIKLVVHNTFIQDMDTNKQKVFVGDYIKLRTVAAKTETEAMAYKYNIDKSGKVGDLTLAADKGNTESGKIITATFDGTDISNKYKIYIKTKPFEGDEDSKQFTTEDLTKVYAVMLNGRNDYTFNQDELETIAGLTEARNAKQQVTLRYTERKPTQREINNQVYDADATVVSLEFNWNKFDSATYHKLFINDDKEYTFQKSTLTIPIGSYTTNDTGITYTPSDGFTDKPFTITLMNYSYKSSVEENNDVYYDTYKATQTEVRGDNVSEEIIIIPQDASEYEEIKSNKNTFILEYKDTNDDTDEYASSLYNEATEFYLLGCALDENNNTLDYAYADTVPDSPSGIHTTGNEVVSGANIIDNNDEAYTGSIRAIDRNINQILSAMTSPDAISDSGNATFYQAISNIVVISNEQLLQQSAIYKLDLITLDNTDYLRIVRYINGQEDLTFKDYNGNVTDDTMTKAEKDVKDIIDNMQSNNPDVTIPTFLTNKLYEIEPDGEVFDIIPGIVFNIDTTMFANIPNGSSTIIITSPRITSTDIPPEGDTYYVSYKYRKSDADYEPKFFDDYDNIVAEYGNYDVSASAAVLNSLSLGAEIAFNNGVSQIVCVQARNNSDYEMQTAIDRLAKSIAGANNVATVIPLSVSDSVGAYLKNHVDLMSSYDYGKERMGYLGARIGQKIDKLATKTDRTLGMTSVASGYDDERIVYVVPGAIKKQIRDLRTGRYNERTLPGCYAAVAVAAIGLANDPAEPLTYKTIAGFTQLVDLYSESEKNRLAGAGCCVLEQNGNTIRIRHGITTCDDDVNSQEITLIQIKDYVIDACRTITADTYIGRKLTQTLIADIKYTMENLLNNFISQGVIINFSSLKVKRSTLDPRQVDVSFEIEAVYPLNWINIEFGFSAVS